MDLLVKKENIRFWIVILATFLSACVVFMVKVSEPLENNNLYKFPLTINDWRGNEIKMEDYVYKSLETPYAFLRNYSSPKYKYPINLSIVWYDDRNISFHAPESCLGGIGNTVKEKDEVKIHLDKDYVIGKLRVGMNNNDQLVLYFFDVDGFITTSQSDIRFKVLMKRMQFKRASASFIRIMAPIETNEQDTMKAELEFLKNIYPLLPEYTHTNKIAKGNIIFGHARKEY